MATRGRSSYVKVHYVGEKGCPIFRSLFITNVIKSHVKIHVKCDAQKVLSKWTSTSVLIWVQISFVVGCFPGSLKNSVFGKIYCLRHVIQSWAL